MAVQEKHIHEFFLVSISLKGAHAAIEILGGLMLAVTSTQALRALVERVTQQEFAEGDFIAKHLLAWAQTFSVQAHHFYAFYLISHGLVNLGLVVGLLMGRLWAYPASLVVMTLFIVYQLYRYSFTHGVGLIVLTVFDIIVIGLIWHEYRLVRRHLPTQ
jgi:uncharacterized membrane protein